MARCSGGPFPPWKPQQGGAEEDEGRRQLLTEAIAMYRQIGMPKHVEMAEALLREVYPPHGAA